jgi:hypothetical protein
MNGPIEREKKNRRRWGATVPERDASTSGSAVGSCCCPKEYRGVVVKKKSIEEQMSYADVATGMQDATPPSMAGANSANRWGNGGLQSTIWRIQ